MDKPNSTIWGRYKESVLKSFHNSFVNMHSGDSGIGGNTPQEPIYELNTNDPTEIAKFICDVLDGAIDEYNFNLVECRDCGTIIWSDIYENQNIASEKDEFFCNEECEKHFHLKNA